ncbi:BTAD domain-containing putative transcriptional regulator [Streptomyces sp. NPDC042319]|uniref:AfsR/SARP family transcriptional regulator n=1 Tax=Streptomyces sp. NPDC042319 TaxID=3154332 RepID=UPI0033EA4734
MSDQQTAPARSYELLGPLRVRLDTAPLQLGEAQQRVVLAVLLLHANQPVSTDRLMEAVWGLAPPARALNLLQRHVSALRRVLEPGRRPRGPSSLLTWTDAGYLLTVPADALDLHVFGREVARAHTARATGDTAAAADALHGALRLWRGRLCEGLAAPLLDIERDRLEEQRLTVLEERIEVDLALGRHAELVAELTGLVRRHPLRERLHAHLMIALYRSGRQAEALSVYRDARLLLVDELGVAPGPELRRLEQAVLTADPALASPPTMRAERARAPRMLPGDVMGFTGRHEQLAELDPLAHPGSDDRGTAIGAVTGAAGVGKTALAVHWAHRAQEAFPDGQLYIDLRGYDPEQPVAPGDALARFLTALGLDGQSIPLTMEDRAARYRSELAGRRILVLLDNASSGEHVKPLLPGSPTCAVLVTSRDSLADLVALHGARRLTLDSLPTTDALALLRRLIGTRVQTAPRAAAQLAALCAGLPLALRIAAELAAARSHDDLSVLVTELTDQQRRLDLLDSCGDPRATVRAVFSWSYQQLPAPAARTFRLLGLHPGPDIDPTAAAALIGTGPEETRRSLGVLIRAHLLHHTGSTRYGMHDLLRAYSAELATRTDPDADRHAALTRLFDHYLSSATGAMAAFHPAAPHHRPSADALPDALPTVTGPDAARDWLEAERDNLVAACLHAARTGLHPHALGLADTLSRYLDVSSRYAEAHAVHTHAHQAARRAGDRTAEARAVYRLGMVCFWQGHYQQARDHLDQSLALFRQTGNAVGEGDALSHLGLVRWRQGHYQQATEHHQHAIALFRQAGDSDGEALALLFLGLSAWRQGECGPAIDRLQQALSLCRQLGNRSGEAYALTAQGWFHCSQGDHERAIELHDQALRLFRQLGNRTGEAAALNGLGESLQAGGRTAGARARHTAALTVATAIGARFEQARAHDGLAVTHLATGDRAKAHRHWADALALYTALGVPEAGTVLARLASLEPKAAGESSTLLLPGQ